MASFNKVVIFWVTFQYRICCQVGNTLKEMARLAGFEPAAYGLEVRCSIQLSYRRNSWFF
jgi:hypothetical protein